MKLKHLGLLLFAASLALPACKKNDKVEAGNVTLDVKVHHHHVPIANARIYIKNNTQEFPGHDTAHYDAAYTTDVSGFYRITNIGNGKREMVIYARGIDPSWDSTGTTPVWGFGTTTIKTSLGEDKASSVSIAVSE